MRLTLYTPAGGRTVQKGFEYLFVHTLYDFSKEDEAPEWKSNRKVRSSVSSLLPSYYYYSFLQTNSISFQEFQTSPTTAITQFTSFLDFFPPLRGRIRVSGKCLHMKDLCFQVLLAMGVTREYQHGTSED